MRARPAIGVAVIVLTTLASCREDSLTTRAETLLGRWHLVSVNGNTLPMRFGFWANDSLVCQSYLDSLWHEFRTGDAAVARYDHDECYSAVTGAGRGRLFYADTTFFSYVLAGDTLRLAAIDGSVADTALAAISGSTLTLTFLAGDSAQSVYVLGR